MNSDTKEVKKRHMKNKGRILCILAMVVLTIAYGFISKFRNKLPLYRWGLFKPL